MRGETMKYKRIVFKVGTSSLTNPDGSLSRAKVKAITQQLATLHEEGEGPRRHYERESCRSSPTGRKCLCTLYCRGGYAALQAF